MEDAIAHFHQSDVKSSSSEVVNSDNRVFSFIDPVSQAGCGRLVYDARDFQTGNSSRILCGLPLMVIEIGRDSDHSIRHLLSEVRFSAFLQIFEDHR